MRREQKDYIRYHLSINGLSENDIDVILANNKLMLAIESYSHRKADKAVWLSHREYYTVKQKLEKLENKPIKIDKKSAAKIQTQAETIKKLKSELKEYQKPIRGRYF